ncbi:type II secretion system protein, partial [Candidatus Saccharibacteria bacterium]|nr:type II secretion system protein [Candidatus Saccharibacteria bacterium]
MDKLKLNKIDKPAFTIIEVVLVLAIAGLIFLMVFIALPALQRNQRDTQRKNDMSRVVSALTSYRANNRGKLPT